MVRRSFSLTDTARKVITGHARAFLETSIPLHRYEKDPALGRREFEVALRNALKFLDRPEALRQNPLVRSRIVAAKTGGADATPKERSVALQNLIRETALGLEGHPKRERAYRALRHTYLSPSLTQEKAAELLDLPFSTYRRHLAEGIALLAETLWLQEIDERMT